MKKIFLISIYILFAFYANSQEDKGYVEVKGTIKYDRQGLRGAKVDVIENGNKKGTFAADAKGRFLLEIDLNKNYELIVKKQEYYSKILLINTSLPPEDVGVWVYSFSVELFPKIEGFDASLLDKPFGKIKFSDEYGEFDADMDYTKSMKKKLEAMMLEYERLKKIAWEKVVTQADEAFSNGDYDLASTLYERAIDLDPYDPYPDDQIFAIDKILSKTKNAQKNYDKAIAEADKLLAEEDYTGAKAQYNKALKFLQKQYPKDKIAYIDEYLNNLAIMNADAAAKEKAYAEAVAAGDRLFVAKQYQSSLDKFTVATGIKPEEYYPKEKITEINNILAQLANNAKNKEAIDKAYREAITVADAGFNSKSYEQARVNYVKASQLKPAETYPKSKINEIDNILAAQQSIEEKYKGFIAVADKAFVNKEYTSAKTNYQQALSIKAGEVYPQSKIKEIDALLLALKAKGKKEREAAYQQAIAKADAFFNQKDYQGAEGFYTQALTIKSNEVYPKQKIKEIDALLADQASKKRAYDMAIAQADNEFNAESYEVAKGNYQKALGIFPSEQYPQSRLNEIANLLLAQKNAKEQKAAREKAYKEAIAAADAFFNEKKYQEAKNLYVQAQSVKPKEIYPPKKIAEIDQLLAAQKAMEEKYKRMVATADQHFLDEKYNDAKTTYTNALQVKPNEDYPKQKISEIDAILAQNAVNSKKRAEIQKQYDAFILKADGFYDNKNWTQARSVYQQASNVKADEVYPKQRITEIDNMLARLAAKDKNYNEAIATADNLFNSKSYGEAIAFYNQASGIKPNENYPKQRIAEINNLLEQQQKNEAAYAQFITFANQAFTNNKLQEAKNKYLAASGVKPNEAYPKKRINEIDALLAEQAKLRNEQERINAKYTNLIATADQYFSQDNLTDAKLNYQQALQTKPAEQYPKEKIAEINNILESLAAQEAAYTNKMKEASTLYNQKNYNGALAAYKQANGIMPNKPEPKQKITEIESLLAKFAKTQKEYEGLISQADALFNSKEYNDAKSLYQNALMVMPTESYPKSQITRIDHVLAEEQRKAMEQKTMLDKYKQLIAFADKAFNSKDYDNAVSYYMDAKGVKSDETYPDQQITKINQLIAADKAKLEAAYNKAISNGDQLVGQNEYEGAKAQYQTALELKPNDPVAQSKLIDVTNLIAQQKADNARLAELNAKYNNFIKQGGNAFKAKDYPSAIAMYKTAGALKPTESYPKDQIELCEKKLREQQNLAAAAEAERLKTEKEAAAKSFDKDNFDYKGEKRDRQFLNELSKQYPEGVTVENYNKPNKKIKRVIVNRGGIAKEYIEVKYSYGTFYFRNGQNISRGIFYSETKE